MYPPDPYRRGSGGYHPLHLPPLPRPPVIIPLPHPLPVSAPAQYPYPSQPLALYPNHPPPHPYYASTVPLNPQPHPQPNSQTQQYPDAPPPYTSPSFETPSTLPSAPGPGPSASLSTNSYGTAPQQHLSTSPRGERVITNDVWRDYMRGLGTSMEGLSVGSSVGDSQSQPEVQHQSPSRPAAGQPLDDGPSSSPGSNKPLPPTPGRPNYRAPSPPRRLSPHRPSSLPTVTARPPPVPPRPFTEAPPPRPNPSTPTPSTPTRPSTDAKGKAFKPSFHPSRPRPSHEGLLQPPSQPSLRPESTQSNQLGASIPFPRPSTAIPVIDLTVDSDESDGPARESSITPRSDKRQRRARATSEQPSTPTSRVRGTSSVADSPTAVRCAGFTRAGQPCKRLVKVEAPYLALRDVNTLQGASLDPDAEGDGDDSRPRLVGRYCKDHASLVCQVDGFYWRGDKGRSGTWIEFKEYIPAKLGQQTQTLLRMTMESPLTAKELPGFLYAYELRDLATSRTSFYKVGRTDNVPRRIGQWTKQCASHTPTLRDIFPLKGLSRRPSAPVALLPGAIAAGTDRDNARTVPAVKRWERLVHLELAELAQQASPKACAGLLKPCNDCETVHKEIFPLSKDGYEDVVEVVERWERFVRAITAGV